MEQNQDYTWLADPLLDGNIEYTRHSIQ